MECLLEFQKEAGIAGWSKQIMKLLMLFISPEICSELSIYYFVKNYYIALKKKAFK